MDRRSFIKSGCGLALLASVGLSGCQEPDDGYVKIQSEGVDMDIDGESAMWTWIAYLAWNGGGTSVDTRVTITLLDGQGDELDTFTRVLKEVDASTWSPREVSYIGTPEQINQIADYDVTLEPIRDEN